MDGTIQRSSCSGETTSGAHAGGVCTHQPSAFVTRPICSDTRTCWKIVKPPPPRSFGMFIANRPSSIALRWCSCLTSSGICPPCSSACVSHGIRSSSTNRLAVSWILRSSSLIGYVPIRPHLRAGAYAGLNDDSDGRGRGPHSLHADGGAKHLEAVGVQ